MSQERYAVRFDDTIQSIAQEVLGNSGRWMDLVSFNHLRAPYISTNPLDQLGPILGSFPLQQALLKGDTEILEWDTGLPGYSPSDLLLVPGNIVVLTTLLGTGEFFYDMAQITGVTESISVYSGHRVLALSFLSLEGYTSLFRRLQVSTAPGFQLSHPGGYLLEVYGDPTRLGTVVLEPGQYLGVPGLDLASPKSDIKDALGVDIALDHRGQRGIGPTGDAKVSTGLANLEQALGIRSRTIPGELLKHPGYGNPLQFYIGARQDPGWPGLAVALVYQCISGDPRVMNIPRITFTQIGDANLLDLTVEVGQGGQVLDTNLEI